MNNNDFRSLLEKSTTTTTTTTTTTNNNSNSNNKKNKKKKWLDRDYEYYQTAPEKVDANYKDRARERRQNDESSESTVSEEIVIKKGLDFNLLHQTKEQLKQQQGDNNNDEEQIKQQQQQQQQQNKQIQNKLMKIKCESEIGQSILKVLQQQNNSKSLNRIDQQIKEKQREYNKEIFQTSRMLYLFDLDPDFPQHIPTTILNSKEDCPPVKNTISAKIDNTLLKKMIHYYHPEKETMFINNNIKEKVKEKVKIDDMFSDSESDTENNKNIKEKQQQQVVIKKDDIDSDSDDNIFSDTEEYVCEIKPQSMKPTTAGGGSSSNYFGSNKEDYSNEFKPIGKDEEEEESVNNNSSKDVKIFINKDGELVSKRKEQIKNINSDGEEEQDEDKEVDSSMAKPSINNENEDESEDEYAYPNTDANYEQHENKHTRFNEIEDGKQQNDDDEEGAYDLFVPEEGQNNLGLKVSKFDRLQEEDGELGDNNNFEKDIGYNDDDEDDSEDEFAYPNTDENYEQHEKEYKKEQDKRFNEDSSSESEDDIISLDTKNESLKRKLLGQDSSYGDDYYPIEYSNFGEKPKLPIDEMLKKKDEGRRPKRPKNENQKIGQQMHKINQILKEKAKETGEKFVDIFEKKKK